jgi:hypothetical protein
MGTIDMEGGLSSCINAATALSRQILRNGADPAPLEQLYLKFNTAAMVFAPNSALGTDNLAVLYQEIMPLVSAVGIPESVVQNLMPAV